MSIVLHYFDMYGKAECTRMILQVLNLEYTENTFDFTAFQELQKAGKFEFDAVPALEIDGHTLVESRAIERYLLVRCGNHNLSLYEAYLNDSTISFLDEIRAIIVRFIYVNNDMDGFLKWFETDLPWYLQHLNARVNENYLFVRDSPQHADWAVFQFIWDGFLIPLRAAQGRAILEAHAPKLIKFAERLKSSNSKLSQYLDSRPDKEH